MCRSIQGCSGVFAFANRRAGLLVTSFLFFIDRLSAGVGKAFGWCIVIMTLGTCYEVFMRYVLRAPTNWAFDLSYMMYGALFMMAGAYTLSRNGHVRADVVFRLLPPRVQAGIELVLYILFFFPGFLALLIYGIPYAQTSWGIREVSIYSPTGTPIYPLKALIPVAAFFMLLQGLAETVRCCICLKEGSWPQRLHDVEEMESAILAERESMRARAGQDSIGSVR
jgi:TRAP-type mannitol/chloroaromatic compound transport system permease small subunit